MGPSGAGKSTLLRCFNGLEQPTDSELVVLGYPLTGGRPALDAVRRRTGMVFQHFHLFPQLTVETSVALAQRVVHRRSETKARRRAFEVLDRVGMAGHAGSVPWRGGVSRLMLGGVPPLRGTGVVVS